MVAELSQPAVVAVNPCEISKWLEVTSEDLPTSVRLALEGYLDLEKALRSSKRQQGVVLRRLKISMGIEPSSERRRRSGDPLGPKGRDKNGPKPKDKVARLKLNQECHESLADWHRKMARQHTTKSRAIEKKIMKEVKVEDIVLTPEEEAEATEESRQHILRSKLGGGEDPVYEDVSEGLMRGGQATAVERYAEATVDRSQLPNESKISSSFSEERIRYSCNFEITKVIIDVEKVSVINSAGEKRFVSADCKSFGPPKMRVTWDFLANMAVMASQYATPFNRFAGMVSSDEKTFSAGEISRYFNYVARRLLPVYNYCGLSLSAAAVLGGDDTSVRVTEVSKAFELKLPDELLPWIEYLNIDKATEVLEQYEKEGKTPSLGMLTAKNWGFSSDYKNGKGKLKRLQTTVVWGRSDDSNPKSTVIFYRTHLGGFGNLLDIILQDRPAKKKDLVIQSDLSTANLVSNSVLLKYLSINYAGCASHARRPFAIFEDQDPDLCSFILHMFRGLSINERSLLLNGRNRENTLAVRLHDSLPMWEVIKDLAQKIANKWPATSELGEGARYILKNYKKLTYYIEDPRICLSNNFSERMLRMEKLIEANALFRTRLEGRFALDIVRTMLQTAIAAQTNPKNYLKWLMMSDAEKISESPENFTPLAFSRLELDEIKTPYLSDDVAELLDELENSINGLGFLETIPSPASLQ